MRIENNTGCHDTDWYTKASTVDAFKIHTAEELAGLAKIVNGDGIPADNFENKTITLDNDIDLSGFSADEGWTPIGNYDDKTHRMFSGTFDGGGHIISKLTINHGENIYKKYQGLFGYVRHGRVRNFGLVDVNIIGGGAVGSVAGAIAESEVTQIYSTGTVKGRLVDIGGVVGYMGSTSRVVFCYSTCEVSGVGGTANSVGGIVGHIDKTCSVCSCAALNSKIMGKSVERIGYVVGEIEGINEVSPSNIAYIEMKTIADDTTVRLPAPNYVGITAAQIRADGTIEGCFTSDTGWTTQNGKLPGLVGRTVDLPEHLR